LECSYLANSHKIKIVIWPSNFQSIGISANGRWAIDICPIDICTEWHFAEWHFAKWHFAKWHFAKWRFAERKKDSGNIIPVCKILSLVFE
jgi:hypothetical protein